MMDLPRHISKHRNGMRNALAEIGNDVVAEAKRLIETGRSTGRVYGNHQASAPGETPASNTGRLANSGDYKVRSHNQMVVGEEAPYAGYLEDGTKKMAPRPHLVVAVNNKVRDAHNSLINHGKKEILNK